jgi:hypothetical protein
MTIWGINTNNQNKHKSHLMWLRSATVNYCAIAGNSNIVWSENVSYRQRLYDASRSNASAVPCSNLSRYTDTLAEVSRDYSRFLPVSAAKDAFTFFTIHRSLIAQSLGTTDTQLPKSFIIDKQFAARNRPHLARVVEHI